MSTQQAQPQPNFPSQSQPKAKKPWYRRWWAIVLGVLVVLMVLGSMTGGGDTGAQADTAAIQTEDTSSSTSEDTSGRTDSAPTEGASSSTSEDTSGRTDSAPTEGASSSTSEDTSSSTDRAPVEDTGRVAEEKPVEEPEPDLTSGQQNALRSADDYLSMSGFSRKGLIEQLEYEGYSTNDAAFAADRLNVNWKKEAAESAEAYTSMSGFSRSGLIEQLEYEGYTPKQAEYGANKAL